MLKTSYLDIRNQLNFRVSGAGPWIYLAQDAAAILIAAALAAKAGWIGCALASVILSCVYFRGFGFMHEAVHGIVHPNRKINDLFGVFWGVMCFLPYSQWRTGHLEHHYWAGNIEKDPVMKLCLHVKNGGQFHSLVELGWKVWFPVLAMLQELVFWSNCLRLVKRNMTWLERFSIVMPLAVWSTVFYFSGWKMCATLFLPSFLIYLVMVEAVNFPHHLGLPQFGGETKIGVIEQHLISRSCTYGKWLERHILVNFNYHAEHHLYPTLPFSELDKAHLLVKQAMAGTSALNGPHNVEPGLEWIVRNKKKALLEVLYSPAPAEKDQIKRSS